MENAIPPAPQNAGKKKMGCFTIGLIVVGGVIGLFVLLIVVLALLGAALGGGKTQEKKDAGTAPAAMVEKVEGKEAADLKKEKDEMAVKLKAAEDKLKAMEAEKKDTETVAAKKEVADDYEFDVSEEDLKEARENQARLGIQEAAQKESEEALLKALTPKDRAFHLFKKKFLVNLKGSYQCPGMEVMIRENSHDPDSFEHIDLTCKFEKGKKKGSLGNIVLQEKFRGKNALGAKVINYAVLVYDFDKEEFVKERAKSGLEPLYKETTLIEDVQSDQIKNGK